MTRFADLHHAGTPLILPNAWDFASGAALAAAGHPAIGTTSLGVAAAAGKPDGTGATRTDTIALTRLLAGLPTLLTVDIEAGFSDDPAEVAQLAVELAEAGAVGVNIEDARPDGTLDEPDLLCAKVSAIKQAAPELFVNARTDAYWLAPAGLVPVDEARTRGAACAAAGADGFFVPAVAEPDEVAELVAAVPVPLNVLYLPGRHTVAELAAAGVGRISTGSLLFRAALGEAVRVAGELAGLSTDGGTPSYGEVQELIG